MGSGVKIGWGGGRMSIGSGEWGEDWVVSEGVVHKCR